MIYLLSLLGYGDSIITGSIIESMVADQDMYLVGTNISKSAWSLLHKKLTPRVVLFDDFPAFYSIKASGFGAAWRDFEVAREWAVRNVKRDDSVIFERGKDLRSRLMLRGLGCEIVESYKEEGAYVDRANMLGPFCGVHEWMAAERLCSRPKQILINPCARDRIRAVPKAALYEILKTLKEADVSVHLVDYDGSYDEFARLVNKYLYRPGLETSVEHLRSSDFYIGPDSFFIHLAYYFRIPQLAFFWGRNTYFVPPGLVASGGVFFFDNIGDLRALKGKILTLIDGDFDDGMVAGV